MRTDQDISLACTERLHSTSGLDDQDIAVKVIDGVALEGELNWCYQRDVIEAMVRSVRGVKMVANKIRVGKRSSLAAFDPAILKGK